MLGNLNGSTRIHQIDAMKGFAIMVVLLENYLQQSDHFFLDNLIFRVIHVFGTPLFFFISGYLAKPLAPAYVNKKFTCLALPFLCWLAVNYFVLKQYLLSSFPIHMVKGVLIPSYGLWFLWTLFLCHCVLWLCVKGESRLGVFAFLLGTIVIKVIPLNIEFGSLFVKENLPFVIAGYLVCKYKELLIKYKSLLTKTALVIFPILVVQPWIKPLFILGIQNDLSAYLLSLLRFIIACLGMLCSYAVINYLISFRLFEKVFCWFGLYTFEIYVTQGYLLKAGIAAGLVMLPTLILAVIMPILIAKVLQRVPVLNVCLYGRNRIQPFISNRVADSS